MTAPSARPSTGFLTPDPELQTTTVEELREQMASFQETWDAQVDDLMSRWYPTLSWHPGDAAWIRRTINGLALAETGDPAYLGTVHLYIDNLEVIQDGYPDVNLAAVALWSNIRSATALTALLNPADQAAGMAETAAVVSETAAMLGREHGMERFDGRAAERLYRWFCFCDLEDIDPDQSILGAWQSFDLCYCLVRAHHCFVSYMTGTSLDNLENTYVLWRDFLLHNGARTRADPVPAPTPQALHAVLCGYAVAQSTEYGSELTQSQIDRIREITSAQSGLPVSDPSLARALEPLDLDGRHLWHFRG